jgi:HD-GYP domain-containing protein (c-di-GMP phosphodiesterase class II)
MRDKLTQDMISVGSPIPWDLLNNLGEVVFHKGFVINTDRNLQRILNMDLFLSDTQLVKTAGITKSPPPVTDQFLEIERLADQFNDICAKLCDTPEPSVEKITGLTEKIRSLYAENPCICLAAIHFRHDKPYSCLQPVYSAFLVELWAENQELDQAAHHRLSCAALTANLGMFEFHDQWSRQNGPLSDEQMQLCRQHPEISVQRLRAAGITDQQWLDMIHQHHERADGSGYPQSLSGDGVMTEALILGLIDTYLSLVMPRAYRKMMHPTEALRIIYEDQASYHASTAQTFIQLIGVYPPGTSVYLANGEIAVVTEHTLGDSARPSVISVADSNHKFFSIPIPRNTSDKRYKILRTYVPDLDHETYPAIMVDSWPCTKIISGRV